MSLVLTFAIRTVDQRVVSHCFAVVIRILVVASPTVIPFEYAPPL